MSAKRLIYQTNTIVIPANTSPNTEAARVRLRFQPDARAALCTGIALYVNRAPVAMPLWRFGVKNDNETFQELTNWQDWNTTTGVGHSDRYKPFAFRVFNNNQLTAMLDLMETNTSELSIDTVFRYEMP